MTDSNFGNGGLDAAGMAEAHAQDAAWLEKADEVLGPIEEQAQQAEATEAQYAAEQADPRNQVQW